MITREQVDDMFKNIRAQSNWDVDGVLMWGYFFTAAVPAKLREAASVFVLQGYRCKPIYKAADGSTNVLRIEREERHTPDTLHERNCEFERLANELNLDSYDGMDVGSVR
jgi:hypothetical protein